MEEREPKREESRELGSGPGRHLSDQERGVRLSHIKTALATLNQAVSPAERAEVEQQRRSEVERAVNTLEQQLGAGAAVDSEAIRRKLADEAEERAWAENRRFDELRREAKMLEYLRESLPDSEERIAAPMDSRCEVSLVVPAYAERECILDSLASLTEQEGVTPDQFEVIIVVNNGGTEPKRAANETDADYKRKLEVYRRALTENQEVLKLIQLLKGEAAEVKVSDRERRVIERIRQAGIRIHAIDKASPGQTLPPGEANVGGARNRGVAEAAARFYEQLGRNGIIAQSDADTKFDPNYIRNLIRVFAERPELVGLAGELEFEQPDMPDEMYQLITQFTEAEYRYKKLLEYLRDEKSDKAKSQTLLKNVSFSGANMAGRAFESAAVGGVPRIPGGEDPAFGERLAAIGVIDSVPEVKVRTANRFSARTAVDAGHGQRRIKMAEALESNRTVVVENPRRVQESYRIRGELMAALRDRTATPERLKQIMTVRGQPLLDDSELGRVSQIFSREQDLDRLAQDPELLELGAKYSARLIELWPNLPLEEGRRELFELLTQNESLKSRYEELAAEMLRRERELVGSRVKMLEKVYGFVQAERPEPLDGASLLEVILEHRKELGLEDKSPKELSQQEKVLEKMAELITTSRTAVEFIAAAKINLRDKLTSPDDNPLQRRIIEFRAMQIARTDKMH